MKVLTRVAVAFGGLAWLPRFSRYVVGLDRLLQRLTRGHVSLAGLAGLPSLVLTTTGRRSGLPRSTPLLYTPHQGVYLVAGSNWGGPTRPAWVLNLLADPAAEVSVQRRRHPVRARRVVGEERAEMWEVMLRTWPNYAKYAERTEREIPVFVLEPRP